MGDFNGDYASGIVGRDGEREIGCKRWYSYESAVVITRPLCRLYRSSLPYDILV